MITGSSRKAEAKAPLTDISRSKILVTRLHLEDNNYLLSFEYFIDFSDKQKCF